MKISIITVTYNSEKTIAETIESVLQQEYREYEHIIVDNASKDKTIKIIKEYEKKYNGKLKYISEPDKGIYDAMNKGIKMATGDIIGLLNSDDKYADKDVLDKIATTIVKNNCDGIYANLIYMDAQTMKKPIRKWITKSINIEKGNMIAHPTLYLKKKVYKEIGEYNLAYKIAADYDFIIRLLKPNKYKLEYINEYLIYMRTGGISSNGIRGYKKNLKEAYQALKNNNINNAGLIIVIRIFKTVYQMIKAKLIL